MLATNPLQIDGQTFDRYSLNLAITGKYNGDGTTDAHVAMRLIPTRIEDGQVHTADAARHQASASARSPEPTPPPSKPSPRSNPHSKPTSPRKDCKPWPSSLRQRAATLAQEPHGQVASSPE
jgi:hypothetical protein